MIKRFLIVGIILAVLLGGLTGFDIFRKMMMGKFFASMVPPPSPVAVVVAQPAPVPQFLEAIGSIEAVRQVVLSPETGGRVVEITFEAGQSVKKGGAILRLNDDPEKGDLEIFRAQAKLAELNLNRSNKLADVAAPRTRIDEFRSLLDEARGNIARTEARIAQKLITAPFDGVLGLRQVDLGQYLNPGDAVATLTDPSELFVNFTLPEQNLAQLATGQVVKLSVDAYPEKAFEAVINAIEPQVGEDTRTVKIQAKMDNPENLLAPGMFAKVTVVLPEGLPQIIVPETSVDFSIYGDSVFVVRDGDKDDKGQPTLKADRVYIKAGQRFDNKVAIIEGLKPGEKVVTAGQLKLNPGAAVTLAKTDTLADDYKTKQADTRNE